jgi:putative PIN family toxin of toxin-antitoxin system
MSAAPLVVFDCNIYLQTMLSSRGPAAGCFDAFRRGDLRLVISPFVIAEILALPAHKDLRRFASITPARVDEMIATALATATLIPQVPTTFELPRDPDDAHYVNLALAANASLIVSRDSDLLDLMNPAHVDGRQFLVRFSTLRILSPNDMLRELERPRPTPPTASP